MLEPEELIISHTRKGKEIKESSTGYTIIH